jgi:hypothetical protein
MSGSDKGGISDEDERRDEVLKRMLNTKPQKHKAKQNSPKGKKATKNTASK